MQFDTALALVRDDLTHPQVHRLINAIATRRALLRDLRAALVTVGANVTIQDKIKGEAFLTGLSGTVLAIYDDKYADLLLDEHSTQALAAGPGKSAHPMDEGTTRYLLTGMPLSTFAVTAAAETFTQVIAFILGQATSDQLDGFNAARKQRTEHLTADLAVGDTVMLADIKRQYLAGLTGTVQAIDRAKDRFSLLLDERSTERLRYHGRNHKITIPYDATEYRLPLIAIPCALIISKG